MAQRQLPFMRIICRKLPPGITEEKFLNIDVVKKGVEANHLTVQFYTYEDVGETSAPNTSVAILTGEHIPEQFVLELTELQLELPFGGFAKPQVEFAPMHVRFETKQPNIKPLPPIDEDPEFVEFSKNYKSKMEIPTDKLIPVNKLPKGPLADNNQVIDQFNKALGGKVSRVEEDRGPRKRYDDRGPKNQNKRGKRKN